MKLIIVIAFLTAFAGGQWHEEPAIKKSSATLRDEVRQIIAPKCGSCHTSSLPTAKPGAIKIFDLKRNDWPSTISSQQFEKFKGRLSGESDNIRKKIDKLVESELAQRKNSPR
jgi:mono/diheme cytochrome c family protein